MSVDITCDERGCLKDVDELLCNECLERRMSSAYDEGRADGLGEAEESKDKLKDKEVKEEK